MKVDISDFVKNSRDRLLRAIEAAGVPLSEVKEVVHKDVPFGDWRRPATLLAGERPVARYWLSYPKAADGTRTAKFNIQTFREIEKWLNNPPPNPNPSSTEKESP